MKVLSGISALLMIAVSTTLQAAPLCGELTTAYGPFDYTNSDDRQKKLPVVEQFHFTPNVEKLIKGQSASVAGDLNYTLITFPNHHRALASMVNLALRDKTSKPRDASYSIDCYFDRALRFKPTDGSVRMIYGNYLLKLGQQDKAIEQLNEAVRLQPENPNINYNLGLLYFQKKDYEQAKTYAKKAYELGFPLPGLKNKLMEAGKWED